MDERNRILDHRGRPIKRRVPLWKEVSLRSKLWITSAIAALAVVGGVVGNVEKVMKVFTPGKATPKAEVVSKPSASEEGAGNQQIDASAHQSEMNPEGGGFSLAGLLDTHHLIAFDTATDVALISVLDPESLDHRLKDDEDWWHDDSQLVAEMNRGAGIFIVTGIDGFFEVLVHGREPRIDSEEIRANFSCEGNVLYVGGFPPDGVSKTDNPFGGEFFTCPAGHYSVAIRSRGNVIDLTFSRLEEFSRNSFTDLPHLDEF